MARDLKTLGLTLAAVLSLAGALAPAASAYWETEAENTTLSVSSNTMQKFAPTSGGIAIECTTISVNSFISGKGEHPEIFVEPSYSNCETFLGAATSVKTNGCNYELFLLFKTGYMSILCPSGKAIEIKVGSICAYTIGTQYFDHTIRGENTGTGATREVVTKMEIFELVSNRTTNDFFCPAGGTTGTYTGNFTLTGTWGGHVGLFVE